MSLPFPDYPPDYQMIDLEQFNDAKCDADHIDKNTTNNSTQHDSG